MANIRASYNTDRQCLGEILPLDTPLSVILDVSERCNFRCCYCFRSKPRDEDWDYAAKNNFMPMRVFQQAVAQLSEFPQKVKLISLSGHGEPLCNHEIAAMARYLKGSGAAERIEMHTNASLLTADSAKEIARAGFTRVVVSLQGLNADAYARVCGARLDWDAFYEKLRILYENKNDDLMIHIKISEAALDPEDHAEEETAFYSLFGPIADSVSVEKVVPLWRNLDLSLNGAVNKYGQEVGTVECCPIMFYKMWVAPDGEVYPCSGLPAPVSLGNIGQISLRDAWNSQKRKDLLASHLRSPRGGRDICMGCAVPVNTVTMEKDRVDPYREDVLRRLEGNPDE